ncbi:MAG: DUF4340 domain-containing protein [Chrysiogenetes bacterium]|nr:DUF4340 domain-containing protein [Chrysiogenetes bacterium]
MKRIGILLGILAGLALIVMLVPKQTEKISGQSEKMLESVFPSIVKDELSKVEIVQPKGNVTLTNTEGVWEVTLDGNVYGADERNLDRLLESMGQIRVDRLVSHTAEKHDIYEVTNTKGATVTFYGKDGGKLMSIVVGKLGPDLNTSYVRHAGESEVYVIDGALRPILEREPKLWRDRTFARINPDDVHEIRVEKKGNDPLVISRDTPETGAWRIKEPDGYNPSPTTGQLCDNVARQLASMVASDLPPRSSEETMGFDKPAGIVIVTEFNGKQTRLTFGKNNDKSQTYARRSDNDTVYLIQSWMAERLLPDVDTLKPQKVE